MVCIYSSVTCFSLGWFHLRTKKQLKKLVLSAVLG
jgi:hypothetical protein